MMSWHLKCVLNMYVNPCLMMMMMMMKVSHQLYYMFRFPVVIFRELLRVGGFISYKIRLDEQELVTNPNYYRVVEGLQFTGVCFLFFFCKKFVE